MAAKRQEVEEELERTSASIAGSISRIKKELSFPVEPVRSVIKKHPLKAIVGTVVTGIALGWAVSGRKKGRKNNSRHIAEDPNLGASQFLHFVRAGRASGLSEDEAVSRALAATSNQHGSGERSRGRLTARLGDHMVDMAEAMIKTAMQVATREAAGWIAESIKRDKPGQSQ